MLIVPSLVVWLLLGEELTGIAIPLARVAGIALIALGFACWPGPPRVGMLIYGAGVTLYLACLGIAGVSTVHTLMAGGGPACDPDGTFDSGINKRQANKNIDRARLVLLETARTLDPSARKGGTEK